jgi:hypothetical protein
MKSSNILRAIIKEVFFTPKGDNPEIKISGELTRNFVISEDNSSGSLYSLYERVQMFSYNPTRGFKEVKGTWGYTSQNANGSTNNEYGICFLDCMRHYDALFFVLIHEKQGEQSGMEPWDELECTVYSNPTELMCVNEIFSEATRTSDVSWDAIQPYTQAYNVCQSKVHEMVLRDDRFHELEFDEAPAIDINSKFKSIAKELGLAVVYEYSRAEGRVKGAKLAQEINSEIKNGNVRILPKEWTRGATLENLDCFNITNSSLSNREEVRCDEWIKENFVL